MGAALPVQPECAVVLPAVTRTLTKNKNRERSVRKDKGRAMIYALLLPLNGLLFLRGLTDIPET